MRMQHSSRRQPEPGAGRRRKEGGFALVLVMAFLAVSMIVVGGLLSWTSQNALLSQRHQDHQGTFAVQNVAGEFVVASMRRDLREGGIERVLTKWAENKYQEIAFDLENPTMFPEWIDYEFAIQIEPWPGPGPDLRASRLLGTYGGMTVTNQEFVIRSGARWLGTTPPMAVAVEEWVQVAEIPVFAFAALYDFDLSFITPPAQYTTLGSRVHSNTNIYTQPSGTLIFEDHVTSAATNHHTLHPNDLAVRTIGDVIYNKENGAQVGRLHVPGAGNNVRAKIMADYWEKAELTITVSDSGISPVYATNFVRTHHFIPDSNGGDSNGDGSNGGGSNGGGSDDGDANGDESNGEESAPQEIRFRDRREQKEVRAVELDLSEFSDHYQALGSPQIIWIQDDRTLPLEMTETMPGIRLVNGLELPESGLTVVTPNPLYVKGHFNWPEGGAKRPAVLVADAVTILSHEWEDPGTAISVASETVVNAAILTGIVPSENGSFDGGFFNALRLLEDWRNRTLTFNGSVVALYRSEQAIEPWRPEVTIYYAPVRQWTFDPAFLDPGYLPWTPVVCTLVRTDWSTIPAGLLFTD